MRNDTIDGFRLIAAFFIVCLHAGLPYLGSVLTPFYRMAVPFFLLISGFYLYDNNRQKMNQKIQKSMKRIFLLWLQATVLFSIVTYLCFPEDWVNQAKLFLSTKFWILNIAPFNTVLWYLLAYLYTLAIIYGLNKLININKWGGVKYALFIIPCLLINYVIGEFRPFIFSNPIDWTYQTNFVTMGIPIVMIGMACGKYKRYLPKISTSKYVMWILLFYTIAIIQWYAIKRITHEGVSTTLFLCSTIPMVLLTLCYSLSNPCIFGRVIPKLGRLYSLDIYVYHIMFLWPLLLLIYAYPSMNWIKNAVVVFLLTMGFATLKLIVKNKIQNRA